MSDGLSHTVRHGDCVSSLAQNHGLFWEAVWNDPHNGDLRRLRQNPNVLQAGDVLFIPARRENEEAVTSDSRYRFRRKGIPAKIRFRLIDEYDQPRANVPYVLDIDGVVTNGTVDSTGSVEISIAPNAKQGTLTLTDGDDEDVYELLLGHLDPVHEEPGARQRLHNLGFECVEESPLALESALKAFQSSCDLELSGALDKATQDRLLEQHGC